MDTNTKQTTLTCGPHGIGHRHHALDKRRAIAGVGCCGRVEGHCVGEMGGARVLSGGGEEGVDSSGRLTNKGGLVGGAGSRRHVQQQALLLAA
jgi:hypothetical protein